MPAVFLDRVPLPSLQAYTSASILLLSCSVYYSVVMTSQPEWVVLKSSMDSSQVARTNVTFVQKLHVILMNHATLKRAYEVVYYMIQEPLCIWTLINMAYCCLILLGKFIQKLVFGDLRVAEQQHIKDKFWNFVFYKFIFIFGVMNVQYMDEVVLWCSWFSVLGFLHLLVQLCKDRYEYLSFSPTTSTLTHVRLFALLFGILSTAGFLFSICIFVGLQTGINTFCFMGAECTLVVLRTLYVICRYAIHLWDVRHEGVWEKRVTFQYYSDLLFDLAGLSVDFLHHLHMLLWSNILLSMASLVICMQLRYLFNEIQRRVKRHKNYLQVAKYMEQNYPVATPEELEVNSDDCAICWDHMESARKLPCGHLFHTSCLRSWLEQVSTCPTCRMSLITRDSDNQPTGEDMDRNNLMGQDDVPVRALNQTMNHFFHFDGSRYVSWFPSFSVEVSHTNLLGVRQPPPIQTSQLDNMAYQVLQMFPHIPIGVILDDLRMTRSVEHTVENILDERIVLPPSALFQSPNARRERSPSLSTSQSSPENCGSDSSASIRGILHQAFFDQPSTSSGSATPCSSSSSGSTSSCHKLAPEDLSPMRNDCEVAEIPIMMSGGEGCRFSKSSLEREQMLSHRKEELLKRARTKYMSKVLGPSSGQGIITHGFGGRSYRSRSSSSSSSSE